VAEEILKDKKNDVATLSLIPSSGGVFEVVADGKTIFSKKQTGRRPEPGEVVTSLNGAA
jgi:selenoprotein W-related protein